MFRRYERTNPPEIATAYRAAGRTRVAVKEERASGAASSADDAWEIPQELLAAFRQLKALQDHATSLGLFVEDRDLLACDSCGLEEDLLITGHLITRQGGEVDNVDSGLRFREEGPDLYACPRCGHQVSLEEEPLEWSDEAPEGEPL